jgi:hypothetical protein
LSGTPRLRHRRRCRHRRRRDCRRWLRLGTACARRC